MNRTPVVAGNWKMHGSRAANASLVSGVLSGLAPRAERVAEVVLCPPFVYLAELAQRLDQTGVGLGAQDVCAEAGRIEGRDFDSVDCRWRPPVESASTPFRRFRCDHGLARRHHGLALLRASPSHQRIHPCRGRRALTLCRVRPRSELRPSRRSRRRAHPAPRPSEPAGCARAPHAGDTARGSVASAKERHVASGWVSSSRQPLS